MYFCVAIFAQQHPAASRFRRQSADPADSNFIDTTLLIVAAVTCAIVMDAVAKCLNFVLGSIVFVVAQCRCVIAHVQKPRVLPSPTLHLGCRDFRLRVLLVRIRK